MAKVNRKHGRNSPGCKSYRLSKRREHNKIRKLKKVLARNPNDTGAAAAITRMNALIRGHVPQAA